MTRRERHVRMDRARGKLHEAVSVLKLDMDITDADIVTVLLQMIADVNSTVREEEEQKRTRNGGQI